MSILESIQALTTEQTAAARKTYSALIREQHPTPAQAEVFKAAMELLGKTPADVRADEAIIQQVQAIKAMLPTPRMVAAKKAAAERADLHAAGEFAGLAAEMALCGPPFVVGPWLARSLANMPTMTGEQRAEFAARINAASRGISVPPNDAQASYFRTQQWMERCGIIDAHPDIYPGGQFDPRWSDEQPAPADAQAQAQDDPAPEVSADVEAVEPAPAPAEPAETLPFGEPATE